MCHRCLAVRAGDGGDASRLDPVELRCQLREPQPRILVGDKSDTELADIISEFRRSEHDSRAAFHRIFNEASTVGLRTLERSEQESRPDLTAVRRKSAEFHRHFFHRCRRSHLPNTCLRLWFLCGNLTDLTRQAYRLAVRPRAVRC